MVDKNINEGKETPKTVKRRRKAVVKNKEEGDWWNRLDKIVNVLLVIVAILWIIGKIVNIPPPQTIEQEATGLFSKQNNSSTFNKDVNYNKIADEPNITKKASTNIGKTSKLKYNNNVDTDTATGIDASNTYGVLPLTADILDGAIAQTNSKPLILFVWASWCPYCKKQFPLIDDIARNKSVKYKVISVSIDKKPEALNNFLKYRKELPFFAVYSTSKSSSMSALYRGLAKKDLHFNGSVPYMVIFWKGKVHTEIRGLLEESEFRKILENIR